MATTIDVANELKLALQNLQSHGLLSQTQVGHLFDFITMGQLPAGGTATDSEHEYLCKVLAKVGGTATLYGFKT